MASANNFKLQSSMKIRRSHRSGKLWDSATRLFSREGITANVSTLQPIP
jgi:hypothetical protein